MKTRIKTLIAGIIISISIVSILMNVDQAFAFCDAHSQPCFERIKTYDKIDDHFVRNYIFDYADDVFVHYDWPNKSDNVANNFDGFPAVYCFEIIADGEPHFLMVNWIDHKNISNIVDMYVPELCEQSINPINSENRPDSLYVKKPMKTLIPKSNVLMLSTPNLHPDDLQSCLVGDFDNKNYEWCNNYKEKISLLPPLKQFKSGVTFDEIQCRDNLVLLQKHDGSSACVENKTIPKLIQRGWIDTDPREQADKNIPKFLCELYGGGFFDGTGECMDLKSSAQCKMLGGKWDNKCMIPNYAGKGIGTEPDFDPQPELEPMSESESQLYHAKKSLESAYYENVNLGPLKINDVILGFGIEDDTLVMDVNYRYSTSSEMEIVKKKIHDIVGEDIQIQYIPYKPPPDLIDRTMPYHWNQYLHKNNIEFVPANIGYGNNDDGFGDGDILCSPLLAPNGTEFYIASTVNVEPFEIIDTFIVEEKLQFCKKTWKTDVLLEEPDRIVSLWLAMGQGKISSE